MICTFGDVTDVVWWRELDLPNRAIIGFDGRIIAEAPDAITSRPGAPPTPSSPARPCSRPSRPSSSSSARRATSSASPKAITHPVKFFEKGDKPLEIVSTRQWYIGNGARDEALRDTLLEHGRELDWHPDFMRVRYENWVSGLTGDWLISRQRFFGVPIPVWYPLDADGNPRVRRADRRRRATCSRSTRRRTRRPASTSRQRGEPGGFVGEHDVMDTWATSSLTPQLAAGWERDPELFDLVFPYSLRPQGQDIIRTWLFSTVLRAELEHGVGPWANAAISGFIVDPDRKKMSKSKGNVVTPADILEQHGSDAVRYWAASSRLGTDAAFDPQNPTQIKIGRRLAIKVLNAAKFILGFDGRARCPGHRARRPQHARRARRRRARGDAGRRRLRPRPRPRGHRDVLLDVLRRLPRAREGARLRRRRAPSRRRRWRALKTALCVLLRLFAPVVPFATEEAWRWSNEGSVHARRLADDRRARRARRGRRRAARAREPRAHGHPPRQDRREGVAEDARR